MRKEITKKQYVMLTFGLIILGVIAYSIFVYLLMISGIDSGLIRYAFFLGLAGIIIGVGVGLSLAYYFKIKDYQYN